MVTMRELFYMTRIFRYLFCDYLLAAVSRWLCLCTMDKREANIRRNEEFLSSLGLDGIQMEKRKSGTGGRSNATKRGAQTEAEKRKRLAAIPVRRSGRVTLERLRAEVEEAKERGEEEVVAAKLLEMEEMAKAKQEANITSYTEEYSPQIARLEAALIPLHSADSEGNNINDFLASLKSSSAPIVKKEKPRVASSSNEYEERLRKLSLSEDDVAKVCFSRILSTTFLPIQSKVVIAAGDKGGCVGLWDVDSAGEGIYRYSPHVSGIPTLHAGRAASTLLYSVSNDGTIRALDLEKEAFSLTFTSPDDMDAYAYLDAAFNRQDSAVYLARSDGCVSLLDLRASSYQHTANCQDTRINSVQIHPTNVVNLTVAF